MNQPTNLKGVAEIEAAIRKLPRCEIEQLCERLEEYLESEWDKQMEADAAAGRLDRVIARAEKDIEAGRVANLSHE